MVRKGRSEICKGTGEVITQRMPTLFLGTDLLECVTEEWLGIPDSGSEAGKGAKCSQVHGSKEPGDDLQTLRLVLENIHTEKKQYLVPAARLFFLSRIKSLPSAGENVI